MALFFLLLGFIFMAGIGKGILKTASKNRCTESILKSSVDGLPNFKCEADYATLKRDELESMGDLNDELDRKIADMMLGCWKLTGSGKIDPYRTSYEVRQYNKAQTYLICDVVEFENIPDFKGLDYWMAINKPASLKDSYFKALYGREATPEEMETLKQQADAYNTTERYAVAWRQVVDLHRVSQNFVQTINNSIVFVPYTELVLGKDLPDDIKPVILMN